MMGTDKHEPGSFVCQGSNSFCLWKLMVFREVCKASLPGRAIILTSEDSEALTASNSPVKKLLLLMLLASKTVQRKFCLRKNVCTKYTENMVKKGIYSAFSIVYCNSTGDYNVKQVFKQIFIFEQYLWYCRTCLYWPPACFVLLSAETQCMQAECRCPTTANSCCDSAAMRGFSSFH